MYILLSVYHCECDAPKEGDKLIGFEVKVRGHDWTLCGQNPFRASFVTMDRLNWLGCVAGCFVSIGTE